MQDALLYSVDDTVQWSHEWMLPPNNLKNLTVFSIYKSNGTEKFFRGADDVFITKHKGIMKTSSKFTGGKNFDFPTRMNTFYQDSLIFRGDSDVRKSFRFTTDSNYLESAPDDKMCNSKTQNGGDCLSLVGINLIRKGLLQSLLFFNL